MSPAVCRRPSATPNLKLRLLVRWDDGRRIVRVMDHKQVIIGRDLDAWLHLDDPAVSRRHARLRVGPEGAILEDLDSANGLTVNGEPTRRATLARGDRIRIGRITIVPVGDEDQDNCWQGHTLGLLPAAVPTSAERAFSATAMMCADQMAALTEADQRIERAWILSLDDRSRAIQPFDTHVDIGRTARLPATGWGATNRAARVHWDGRRHVVQRLGWPAQVHVNGTAVRRHPLRHGDEFQVGTSRFRYHIHTR